MCRNCHKNQTRVCTCYLYCAAVHNEASNANEFNRATTQPTQRDSIFFFGKPFIFWAGQDSPYFFSNLTVHYYYAPPPPPPQITPHLTPSRIQSVSYLDLNYAFISQQMVDCIKIFIIFFLEQLIWSFPFYTSSFLHRPLLLRPSIPLDALF